MVPNLTIPEEIELDKVCRCCLSMTGTMRSLYGSCLDDMLQMIAQVKVESTDGLPDLMCFQCVLQVSRAFRFKQQCERTDSILRSYLAEKVAGQIRDPIQNEITFPVDDDDSKNCVILLPNADPISNIDTSSPKDTFEIQMTDDNFEDNFTFKEENMHDVALNKCLETLQDAKEEIELNCPTSSSENSAKTDTESSPEKPNSSSFECSICKKIFAKKQVLRRHIKIHDPNKRHVCKDCGMSFTESSNLTKHQKKHTGELRNVVGKPNLCTVCGKGFKWASSLSKHMNHHTKRKILNCPHCPKYYLESQTLKLHMRTHTGERPFACNTCDKSFTQMCNLEKHMRIHTGEKPFECPICGKSFTQSGYIAIHMRSHTGEKPYMCNVCGKCFAGSNTLVMHKRIHTGEKPYSCSICGKSFARLETATVHQRTHTGEKPHYCPICNRAFISSSHLSNHKKTHNGVKSFNCEQCDRTFSTNSSLKAHMKSHCEEEVPYECNICSKKFTNSTALIDHELLHNANVVFSDNQIDSVEEAESEALKITSK